MAVTAAAQAVMMALLHSPVGGCTSRAAGVYTKHAGNFNGCHILSSWLVPRVGTAVAQRTLTAVAAAAAPGSRRRRGKLQTPPHQEQQQHTQQGSLAASEQPQPDAALQQQVRVGALQDQQQQQHSRQLLWDTAAQLGLKRGSEIAPSASAAAAAADQSAECSVGAGSSDDDLTGSSSSSSSSSSAMAAASRRRRSQASTSSSGSRLDVNTAASSSSSSSSSSSVHLDSNSSTLDQDNDSASDSPADSISFSSRDDAVVAAIARLGRFLDFRERCASEVLTKLAALGYDGQLAQRVLQELQTAGLQSDARFAEMFARGSWRTKAQSPARLAYELRSRGVAQEHIDAAMVAVFGPSRELSSRDAANDKEEEMWEQLVEVCRRRAELTKAEPKQKRRAKLAGWLQRRGHNMSTIFRVFDAVGI